MTPVANRPKTLQQAIEYFSDADRCHEYVVANRWPNGVVTCPTCGEANPRYIQTRRLFECRKQHPRRQFSVKVGSIFEDSPLPLKSWLLAMWMAANCKNGVSSYEVARAIGVTQKSAWHMMHRIRLAMQSEHGGKLGGEVEADETYIGGKARNMHKGKRNRLNMHRGRSMPGKVAVMALLERHPERGKSRVRMEILRGLRKSHVQGHVRNHVEPGSTLHTDAYSSYIGLDRDYTHNVIDHAEAYVDGNVHTNGCENFWSLLKRTIKGTYVSVEAFHLFRYLDEQAFRFNEREGNDADRFEHMLRSIVGKRIMYKTLTAQEGVA